MPPWMNQWYIVLPLVIWEAGWKSLGMWRAARHGQKYWFVAMLLINSLGLLPIVYLKFYQPKHPEPAAPPPASSPKLLASRRRIK